MRIERMMRQTVSETVRANRFTVRRMIISRVVVCGGGGPRRTVTTTSASAADEKEDASSSTRSRLLRSALEYVPEHGWTNQAILAAVRENHPHVSLSYATTLQATDLVQCFMETCNRELRERLRRERHNKQSDDTIDTASTTTTPRSSSRVERLHHAMRLRLEMVATYIAMGRWHQGMALGISQPEAALTTSEQLKDLVSVIVQETDDDDDDDNNSQPPLSDLAQLGLGAVYVATECHMLADASTEYQDTWDFLRQTLQRWESLHQQNHTSMLSSSNFPSDAAFLASTLATAFGHGILSISNVTPPTAATVLSTPNQIWNTAMNTVHAFTRSSTQSSSTTSSSSTTTSTNPGSPPNGTPTL